MTVLKLASSQECRPVHGCGTCRFYKKDIWTGLTDCMAIGGSAFLARRSECSNGQLWEPIPPHVPVLVRFRRWLIG